MIDFLRAAGRLDLRTPVTQIIAESRNRPEREQDVQQIHLHRTSRESFLFPTLSSKAPNPTGPPGASRRMANPGECAMNRYVIEGRSCRLRRYRAEDALAICGVADDALVSRWMTRAFPYPYTQRDADEWVAAVTDGSRDGHFAIEVDGALAGGIGFDRLDGERSGTATFGYWLGRAYWGRGIGTDAARALSDYALHSQGLRRLEASVFAQNIASAKVLEKCGFRREGALRDFYVDRSGAACDALVFGRLAPPDPTIG
ncbi:MAG TPA: GNAT family protein [Candidatus Tumulicola sp.]